ncbi:MAG: 60S ribosomal export protein NMD3 [Candidatus Nanohaloarchaea archaeon]|nr:60S ribosomal export protein NMD3 [Candidatus Nanohaloarchaea archaeon]
MRAPCPRCGDETEGYGPHNLCRDCFLEEEELIEVPDEIHVERCSHCGRVRRGMDWVEVETDRELIAEVLENEVDTEKVSAVSFEETGDGYLLTLMVEATIEGETLQQEVETELEVEKVQCPTCAKFEGGYYEYVIQLRGGETGKVEEALEEVMDRAAEVTDEDRENFVSDVEEVDGGYDLYVSNRETAEELLKVVRERYDMEEKRSKELVGREDGQEVYRSVVSARLV